MSPRFQRSFPGDSCMSGSFWAWLIHRRPSPTSSRRHRDLQPVLEHLESRDVPSGLHPTYVLHPSGGAATPFGSPGPTGTTPAQIRHAYGFDQITFSNGSSTVAGDGRGTTIALIDA